MTTRTGKVKAISSRTFQNIILWSFKLENSDRFYRLGKVEPTFGEGDSITFEEKNGVVSADSVAQIEASAEEATVLRPAPAVSAKPDVGERIRYQAARADATRIVCTALHNDHLPHASNIAKGKRLDLLLGYVNEVTKTLLEQEDAA